MNFEHPATWALDTHMELFRSLGSANYLRHREAFCHYYGNSVEERRHNMRVNGRGVGASLPYGNLIASEKEYLRNARTIYVGEDITNEAVERVDTFKVCPTLNPEDVPWEYGFAVFDEPLPYFDFDHGEVQLDVALPIRAVLWKTMTYAATEENPNALGIQFLLYTDTDSFFQNVDARVQNHPGARLTLIDFSAWSYGTEWTVTDNDMARDAHHQSAHIGRLRQILYEVWEMSTALRENYRPRRPDRRRWDRSGLVVPEDGEVVMYRLPRAARADNSDPNETHVEWSHRWLVRGHWRQIKRKDGSVYHTRVRTHIKGPDDKPFVQKNRIDVVDK